MDTNRKSFSFGLLTMLLAFLGISLFKHECHTSGVMIISISLESIWWNLYKNPKTDDSE